MKHVLSLGLSLITVAGNAQPVHVAGLVGTWTTMKDGFMMTKVVEPAGEGVRITTYLDDLLIEDERPGILTSDYSKQDDGSWKVVQTLANGHTTTFVQRDDQDAPEGLALEQISYNGRPIEPPQSRLFITQADSDTFVTDWQRRTETGWRPRPVPFTHTRVDRPAPAQSRIAFISNRTGNWDVFSMNADGSEVVNHSDHDAGDHAPRWLARGTRLAWLTQRTNSDSSGAWIRWESDIDGTDQGVQDVKRRVGNPDFGTYPELSPDGSYAVYAAGEDPEIDLFISRFDGGGATKFAQAPGPDYRPKWSPDGRSVLFVSERHGHPDLFLLDATDSNPETQLTRLTDTEGIDRYARWSPDGSQIVFASERDTPGALELYLMNADGSNVRRLTTNDAEDGEPTWSPDGSQIAFRSDMTGDSEIFVIDLATNELTNITNSPGTYDAEPTWSPR